MAEQFKVDLQQFPVAISSISKSASIITECTALINEAMQTAEANWTSPSSASFAAVQQACTTQMAALDDLLTEMITRLKATYQNYLDAETANTSNLS